MSFRKQNLMNFQIQITKRQGVVPMTREYIGREEAKLRGFEHDQRPRRRLAGERVTIDRLGEIAAFNLES